MGRGVAVRCVYGGTLSSIVFDQLGEVRTLPEAFRDSPDVRPPTVRGDLRLVDDPLPNVIHKGMSIGSVPLAGGVGDDGFPRGVQGDERILIAFLDFVRLRTLLLLSDIPPCLIEFQDRDLEVAHHAVMECRASLSDPNPKAHDGVPVDSGKAFGRTDGAPFRQGGNGLGLLVYGQNIHGANPHFCGILAPDSGKMPPNQLYVSERSFTSGAKSLGFDRGPPLFQQRRSH
jgi:hypothetical protein